MYHIWVDGFFCETLTNKKSTKTKKKYVEKILKGEIQVDSKHK